MSDKLLKDKKSVVLFTSVAVNIFLVAFTLGRDTAGPHRGDRPMPPPFGQHCDFHNHPPFFGPEDILSPDEIRANEERMHQSFEKLDGLRAGFAKQLDAHPVSKEDVLAHFAAVDGVMDSVKKETQEKLAVKISTMTDDERHTFAQQMLSKNHEPPGLPLQGDDRGPPRANGQ